MGGPSCSMPTSNSRIGPYELNAPGYNPANLEGDIWTDYTCSVAGDQNRNLGVQFPERPYPKMRKVEPKLDMAYREDEQMYRRLDALNAENLRLEQENKLFKKTNVGLKELIPQLPYASIPPAQQALPQFWDDRAGHPVPPGAIGSAAFAEHLGFAEPVPMFAPGLTDHPKKSFDLTAQPGPLDVHVAEVLDEKHQAYLHQRQQIIDDREAEYQALQTKLAGLSEEAVLEPEPVKQPEEVLYAERSHSRVPFGKWEAGGRLYAKQWQLRPERTARGHKYLGEWMGGEEHGRGLYTFQDGKYVGQWEHGRPHGHGVFIYANRDTYEGDWKENREGTHGAANGKTDGSGVTALLTFLMAADTLVNGPQISSMARVSSTLLTAHVIMVHGPRVRTQTREFTKIQTDLHWAVSWHAKRCSHNSRLSGRAAAIKITVSTSLSTFL